MKHRRLQFACLALLLMMITGCKNDDSNPSSNQNNNTGNNNNNSSGNLKITGWSPERPHPDEIITITGTGLSRTITVS